MKTLESILECINWDKVDNLLPVIVQDAQSNDVLMLAYMNKEALILSLETKTAHYFSRTKGRLWKKGESSGHIQHIKDFFLDCDQDTLLLKIKQDGVACHTGRKSCFFEQLETGDIIQKQEIQTDEMYSVIDTLYHTILSRKGGDPEKSYTSQLFHKGENSILKKVAEEAAEFAYAIKDNNEEEIVYEAADLLFHSLVALGYRNISPERIERELARRFGLSGLTEKANREK